MSDLKADWRTFTEGGLELDRIIAEKLGYTEIENTSVYVEDAISAGIEKGLYGRPPRYEMENYIPHFSTDLNDAFTLFSTELGLEWNLFSDFNGITCELGHWNNEPGQADQVEQWNDKTAALAIVKAWLKWQERTDHPAPELPKGMNE